MSALAEIEHSLSPEVYRALARREVESFDDFATRVRDRCDEWFFPPPFLRAVFYRLNDLGENYPELYEEDDEVDRLDEAVGPYFVIAAMVSEKMTLHAQYDQAVLPDVPTGRVKEAIDEIHKTHQVYLTPVAARAVWALHFEAFMHDSTLFDLSEDFCRDQDQEELERNLFVMFQRNSSRIQSFGSDVKDAVQGVMTRIQTHLSGYEDPQQYDPSKVAVFKLFLPDLTSYEGTFDPERLEVKRDLLFYSMITMICEELDEPDEEVMLWKAAHVFKKVFEPHYEQIRDLNDYYLQGNASLRARLKVLGLSLDRLHVEEVDELDE